MNQPIPAQSNDFLKAIQKLLGGAGIGGLGHLGGLEGIYASKTGASKLPDLFKDAQIKPLDSTIAKPKKGQAGGSTTPGSTTAQNKSKPLEFK